MRRRALYRAARYTADRARDKSFIRVSVYIRLVCARVCSAPTRGRQFMLSNCLNACARVDYAHYTADVSDTRRYRHAQIAAARSYVGQRAAVLLTDHAADISRYGRVRGKRRV